jgi:hypothetical protein
MNRKIHLTPSVSPISAHAEALEERKLMAAQFDLGMNINVGTSDVRDKGIPLMKQLGVQSVRVWFGPDFTSHTWEGPLQRCVDYAAAGFDVMLIINPEDGKVPSATQVRSWFKWAMEQPSLKKAVDRWQIGNEIDQSYYWNGSFKQYVSNFLKPASEVLRSNGESVVSASVSWNPEDVRRLINEGILDYVDYVGYHPYSNSISQLRSRIDALKSIVNGRKPLVASEWSIRGYESNKPRWAALVRDAFPIIRDNFDINYYFALLNTTLTPAGPGGIMNPDGSRQTGFFNALASGMQDGNNDNSSSGFPSIAKVSVYLESTGQKIVDSLYNGLTIDLSQYDSDRLRFVAVAGSGVSSVQITLNGQSIIENNEPYQWANYSSAAGSYTLSATPWSQDDLTGKRGNVRTFRFTLTGKPQSSTDFKGQIRGTLWNDSNQNGKFDRSERVTGIRQIFLDQNRNGKLDPGEQSTWSDSDGNYIFMGLAPGTYYVARLFPNGFRLSNNSLGYVTVSLATNLVVGGVNLGSRYA